MWQHVQSFLLPLRHSPPCSWVTRLSPLQVPCRTHLCTSPATAKCMLYALNKQEQRSGLHRHLLSTGQGIVQPDDEEKHSLKQHQVSGKAASITLLGDFEAHFQTTHPRRPGRPDPESLQHRLLCQEIKALKTRRRSTRQRLELCSKAGNKPPRGGVTSSP